MARWSATPSRSVGSAAALIALAGIASRIFGFFRDRMLAAQFGAGDILDAYYAAFRVPDLMYSLLVVGALSAAFIPIFTELISEEKKAEAWKLTSAVLHLLLFAIGGLSLFGILFAEYLVGWLAPGFAAEKQTLTVELTRVMLLSPLFLTLSAVFGGVLVSFKQFAAYSFAPVFYNIGIILGIVFFTPLYGPVGLGWGVVLGSFLHMVVQYPFLTRTGFRHTWALSEVWKNIAVRKMVGLMIPRLLSVSVNQISLVIMTVFASTLISGSLAVFTLANNIQSVPLGLFGIAFALAAFPSLSLFAAGKKNEDFFLTLSETSRRILFFVVPISVLMVIFRAQFVRVILGAGHFDWQDTILTFEVLKFLAISLFAQSLIPLFARAFFALQNTRTPFYIALASEAVHILLIPVLLPMYAVEGLAMAFSVGAIVNFFLLYFMLRQAMPAWSDRKFFEPIAKIFLAALLAGLVAQFSKSLFALTTNELDTFIEIFLQLALGLAIGGGTFLLLCHWFQVEDLTHIRNYVKSKILRRPEAVVLTKDHPEQGEW